MQIFLVIVGLDQTEPSFSLDQIQAAQKQIANLFRKELPVAKLEWKIYPKLSPDFYRWVNRAKGFTSYKLLGLGVSESPTSRFEISEYFETLETPNRAFGWSTLDGIATAMRTMLMSRLEHFEHVSSLSETVSVVESLPEEQLVISRPLNLQEMPTEAIERNVYLGFYEEMLRTIQLYLTCGFQHYNPKTIHAQHMTNPTPSALGSTSEMFSAEVEKLMLSQSAAFSCNSRVLRNFLLEYPRRLEPGVEKVRIDPYAAGFSVQFIILNNPQARYELIKTMVTVMAQICAKLGILKKSEVGPTINDWLIYKPNDPKNHWNLAASRLRELE